MSYATLDTEQLKTLIAIADSGSFTRAAREVNRTQAAVSMQMRRLEETVGRSLFTKNGRSNRLTGDGEHLLEYARRIVALNNEAMTVLKEPELAGYVRIGTPDDYAERFLPRIFARFARTHPLVEIGIICDGSTALHERILADELDLGHPSGAPATLDAFHDFTLSIAEDLRVWGEARIVLTPTAPGAAGSYGAPPAGRSGRPPSQALHPLRLGTRPARARPGTGEPAAPVPGCSGCAGYSVLAMRWHKRQAALRRARPPSPTAGVAGSFKSHIVVKLQSSTSSSRLGVAFEGADLPCTPPPRPLERHDWRPTGFTVRSPGFGRS